MKSITAVLLAVALGASADNGPSFQSNLSCLPVINSHIQTSVVDNPTVNFPSFVPPTTITESCHCLNTLVRPQIHNEVIAVPSVDRIVRTVATPIVETLNCGGGTRLTTFVQGNGEASNEARSGRYNGFEGNAMQHQNSLNFGFMARPTLFTFGSSDGRNSGGRINAFQIRK